MLGSSGLAQDAVAELDSKPRLPDGAWPRRGEAPQSLKDSLRFGRGGRYLVEGLWQSRSPQVWRPRFPGRLRKRSGTGIESSQRTIDPTARRRADLHFGCGRLVPLGTFFHAIIASLASGKTAIAFTGRQMVTTEPRPIAL